MGMFTREFPGLALRMPRFSPLGMPRFSSAKSPVKLLGDMHLCVPNQTTTPDFLNSLGESGLKLSVADEGVFVCWLGQGDVMTLLA